MNAWYQKILQKCAQSCGTATFAFWVSAAKGKKASKKFEINRSKTDYQTPASLSLLIIFVHCKRLRDQRAQLL